MTVPSGYNQNAIPTWFLDSLFQTSLSAFTLRSVIHFELILVCGVRYQVKPFCCWRCVSVADHFFFKKGFFFPYSIVLVKPFTTDWDLKPCAGTWIQPKPSLGLELTWLGLKPSQNSAWDLNPCGWNPNSAKTLFGTQTHVAGTQIQPKPCLGLEPTWLGLKPSQNSWYLVLGPNEAQVLDVSSQKEFSERQSDR